MLITLDNLATRYHCLPSEALSRADTLDLHILDVSAKYAQRQQDLRDGKISLVPNLSQAKMREMIQAVKEQ